MIDALHIISRDKPLFVEDMAQHAAFLADWVAGRRFLVIGGAGSIGREVVLQLAARSPVGLDVVDISENGLTEVTRLVRSSVGSLRGADRYLALDAGSDIFAQFLREQPAYDVVLNFSALKHVRSEKDPWSLMRMLDVNVLLTRKMLECAEDMGAERYFSVSTDKADAPANAMGASKRLMEFVLAAAGGERTVVSTARFANVAFSDGSLLDGFRHRLDRGQPLAAPREITRYFVTGEEAGQLCLLAFALAGHRELVFPKLDPATQTTNFVEIARRFLTSHGLELVECETEDEARGYFSRRNSETLWPCVFTAGDTTGEKLIETFHAPSDDVDWDRFEDLAVIRGFAPADPKLVAGAVADIEELRARGNWLRQDLLDLLHAYVPNFDHLERGQFLDGRM